MSSCDNNASASNHTLTNETKLNEDYNNEQKNHLILTTTTTTTTSSSSSSSSSLLEGAKNADVNDKKEPIDFLNPDENQILNLDLEETATVISAEATTTNIFDNAEALTITPATALVSGNKMLPTPAQPATTKPEEKNEANSSNQDELSLEAAEATSVAATSVAATAVAATAVAATAVAATTYSEDKRVTAAAPASLPITALTDCTTSREAESSQTSGVAAAFPLQQTQGQSACDEPREAVTVNLSPTPVLINTTEPAQETAPAAASPETPPTTPTASHLPQIASEPTFGIILRRNQQEQQQRFRNRHDVRFEGTSVSIENVTTPSGGYRSGVSVSASASPSMGRKSSDASMLMSRRVSFPKSDNELVTGYLEPANPWEHACLVKSISEIAELYVMSCSKHNTKPLQTILDHLKMVELNKTLRQPLLSLKSIKLAPSDCEALEEVFKRVQYKAVDLSSCELTETAAMALFEMIEYYEAANELDISLNACGMTHRGWTSCTYMISHSQALQVLNAQGNPISRTGAENLGHALCTSNLHTIKLEHCGLRGAPLSGLCFKLRSNRVLRELWLAYNDLDCYDAENIAKLLTVNHYLQLIDISNNNIRDEGLKKIVKALITQARELEKHSLLQRAPAIDDDDCGDNESVGSSSDTENSTISCNSTNNKHETNETNSTNVGGLIVESDASQSEDTDDEAFENEKAKKSSNDSEAQLMAIATTGDKIESVATITTAVVPTTETDVLTSLTTTLSTDELDADEEDTEDTMKSTPSTTLKNSTSSAGNGNGGGQSMLDKLLSMNSTESSSSDDIGSNLSTDTLAACCSEDASLISDDIFDGGAATATSTTNTSTNSTALSKGNLAPTPSATANETISSVLTTELDKERREATSDTSNGESSNTESNSSGLSSATSSMSTNSNSNNTNTNNNNNNSNINSNNQHPLHAVKSELNASPCVFELTAEENDCLISSPVTKALDVNKNTAKLMDDFDDTHSTDSAFESASEGDISRHLPEEFSRLSASFESSRIDEVIAASKEFAGVETATIATESTECLVTAAAAASSSSLSCETITTAPLIEMATQVGSTSTVPPTPTTLAAATIAAAVSPVVIRLEDRCDNESLSEVECNPLPPIPPKVTISEDSLYLNKTKLSSIGSPSPTPPPPSTSPGGASVGMRRTESSCAFITPSTRIRSQSSDSLCSDTSLDGSLSSDINFSTSTQINEKLAKNDTLTRQQRQFEAPAEVASKAPCGLKALALWNNNLTRESGQYIAELLAETPSLELLNIGKNCLSNDFISTIKDSLMRNTTLTTLGLQSAHLSAKGIETLSSILTFGGNCTLQRIDIRDNKLEVESLSTLAEVLKSNTTVTQIDIDDEPKRLSIGSDAHLDYARVLENVRSMCSRNEKTQSQLQAADKTAALTTAAGRRRSGYYLGSRKISLTCHTRPIVVDNPKVDSSISITATAHSKLDVKRKTGARLRSPIPSPPTVSPSSSPSRSRFKVFRVSEVSPLTSPMSVTPMIATTTSSVAIPSTSTNSNNNLQKQQSTSLPSASSLSFMATVTSSTESIKRYSVSPRSRFQVSKIYEDPRLPLTDRPLPPISPPATSSPAPVVDSSHTVSSFSASAANTQLNAVKENDHKDHMPTTLDATTLVTPPRAAIVTTVSEVASTELSPIPNFESTKEATNTNVTNSNKTIINTTNTNTANSNATNKNITKTITKDSNVDSSHSYKSTLSPISSASSASSSSSSSSSSSTSPASISSNSSIISASSSSSTESPITPLFSDNTDSDPAQASKDLLPNIGARCPIAVFDENEITLTKNSSNAVRSGLSAQHTESSSSAPVSGTSTPQQQPMQSRVRKTSWLGNPAAVDKLLTLFHNPGTIFQRSSSPDSNLTTSSSTTTQQEVNQPTVQQKSLVPTRKTSPPTWSKLGNEMMRPVTSALQQTINTGEASSAAVLTTTAEQSISFLDAASKQICDFSKQVFRQNLAFGNETNAFGAAGGMVGMQVSSSGSVANSALPEQLDAAHIPSDVQLEIKENISPEHTITDETLHSLQKHCLAAVSSAVSNNNSSALQEPLLEERRVEEAREQQLQVLPLSSSSNSNSNTLMPTVSASNNSVQHEEQQSAKTQTS